MKTRLPVPLPARLRWRLPLGAAVCAALWGLGATGVAAQGVKPAPAPAPGAATVTRWEDLVPKDWDPTLPFRHLKLDMLSDSDPRVVQMMRELRTAWDNAFGRIGADYSWRQIS